MLLISTHNKSFYREMTKNFFNYHQILTIIKLLQKSEEKTSYFFLWRSDYVYVSCLYLYPHLSENPLDLRHHLLQCWLVGTEAYGLVYTERYKINCQCLYPSLSENPLDLRHHLLRCWLVGTEAYGLVYTEVDERGVIFCKNNRVIFSLCCGY